jgi:hypothetical protein
MRPRFSEDFCRFSSLSRLLRRAGSPELSTAGGGSVVGDAGLIATVPVATVALEGLAAIRGVVAGTVSPTSSDG